MAAISYRLLTHILSSYTATGMVHICKQSILISLACVQAHMALACDIYMSSPAGKEGKIPYLAASEAAMIIYLFIELNPKRDSSWQSFLPARRLGGTIWPLWRRIIPDSEILETAVSLYCGANTKAVPWGSTDWVWLLLSHSHSALQSSTGGHACEMKKRHEKQTNNSVVTWHIVIVIKTACEKNCVAMSENVPRNVQEKWLYCGVLQQKVYLFYKCNLFLLWSNISELNKGFYPLLFCLCCCFVALLLYFCFTLQGSDRVRSSRCSSGHLLLWQWSHHMWL